MAGSRSSSWQQQSASQALLPVVTTKITIEADVKNRENILELLKAYEQEHSVFKAHGIKEVNIIFNEIDNILLLDLNIEIVTIYKNDKSSAAMILAAFFGRRFALVNQPEDPTKYLEKDLLSECQHPLHTIMVMCYIAHAMQKKFLGKDSGYEDGEVYEKLKNKLEDLACKIVSHLNSGMDGADRVAIILQADYMSEFKNDPKENTNPTAIVEETKENVKPYYDYLNRKFDQSREIMAIAYKAKARKFLSLRPCLHLMENRNKAVKTAKHTLNWTFRLAYILMFAYMLCRYPFYSSYDSTSSLGFLEMLPFLFVPAVLIAQVSMTIIKSIDHLIFDDFKLTHGSNPFGFYFSSVQRYVRLKKLAFWRVCLVVPLLSLEAIRFVVFAGLPSKPRNFWSGGWVILPLMLELLYCSLFTIATISSLRFFHSIQSIGFFVHIFKKMMKTVGMFILIFCTFWFVLAVTHVSLSRTLLVHNSTFIYTLSLPGKFEIFGEVQDEDRIGILSNCSHFTKTFWDFFEMEYAEASCLFRSTIMPFLVFTYIFVSGILLINLLTAQLTKEYEKQSENSLYYKGYLKYELEAKIESKLYLPPPLSLIYILLRCSTCIVLLIMWGIQNWLKKDSGQVTQFSEYIWKKVIEKMEGHPWGVVRKHTVSKRKDQNAQNGQNDPNAQNAQNGQNDPNAQNDQNDPNAQNSQNGQNAQNAQNGQNAQNAQNGQNDPNVQNAQNGQNAQNSKNDQNYPNALNAQNDPNAQNAQNEQNLQNGQNVPNAQNVQNCKNDPNAQNAQEQQEALARKLEEEIRQFLCKRSYGFLEGLMDLVGGFEKHTLDVSTLKTIKEKTNQYCDRVIDEENARAALN